MDKALKNSTLGNVAYIWRIERFQMDTIKFETTQIHFFSDFFHCRRLRRCLRSLLLMTSSCIQKRWLWPGPLIVYSKMLIKTLDLKLLNMKNRTVPETSFTVRAGQAYPTRLHQWIYYSKAEPLVVVDFSFISTLLLTSSEVVMKCLAAQFSWILCKCL